MHHVYMYGVVLLGLKCNKLVQISWLFLEYVDENSYYFKECSI